MTSQTIAKRDTGQMERLEPEQLKYIANTSFIRADLRGNLPNIMACVLTGRELGMGDLEALRMLYIVDGKVTMPAELMVSRARARGHSITGKFNADNTACTAYGKRVDNGDEMEFTWTMEMAKEAGLDKKKNWVAYRASMLWARAASQLCRQLFPDVLAGASYSREELDEVGPSARDMNLEAAPPVDLEGDERPADREPNPPSPSGDSPLPAGAESAPSPDSGSGGSRDSHEASAESGEQSSFEIPASAKKPVTAP